MAAPDLVNINNFFATRPSVFHKNIYHRTWRTNPFTSLFKKKDYDMEEGRIPTVITSTHELPTAYPTALTKVTTAAASGGTTDPGCDVPATIIKSGYKTRSFQLEQVAFETEVICLSDMQFKYQAVQQVMNKEKGLAEFSTVFMSDWYRVQNIGMIDRKMSTTSATALTEVSNSLFAFTGLTLPTFEANWIHLNAIYDHQIRRGAGEFALGQAGGQPVLGITCGPGYKRKLFQDDEQVRETVNYGSDSEQNFTARGINKAVNGFIPNVDEFPIRIAADGTTFIYPTINQDTTVGRESVPNPDYLTVANGGDAVYELITISIKDPYEVHVRPTGPTNFGKQGYKAPNYIGSVSWINNPDMNLNKLGNKGLYRLDIQQAAKPITPELGVTILTLAID